MVTSRRSGLLHHITAYAVMAALFLSGCSGDGDNPSPAPLASAPPARASATPTADPAPTLPAEARGGSNAAAVAFVEHYIDVLNHTAATLDTTALKKLSADECGGCHGIITRLGRYGQSGGTIDGGQWTIVETAMLMSDEPSVERVQVLVKHDTEIAVPSAGADTIEYSAGRAVLMFDVRRSNAHFRVIAMERVDA